MILYIISVVISVLFMVAAGIVEHHTWTNIPDDYHDITLGDIADIFKMIGMLLVILFLLLVPIANFVVSLGFFIDTLNNHKNIKISDLFKKS